ncbi:MAG: ATP-binding cassette domain-containing protein [Melioribacteraceae bacterium]|nr:ATP-binding cassette domain-containing protein [Melioribacteraceae bacterium]
MKIFLRILSYVKPFWKHLGLAVVSIFMFAMMNGLSIYLTIPLLDTLFNQSNSDVIQKVSNPSSTSLLPEWLINSVNSIKQTFQESILSGSIDEVLFKISLLIVLAFILKNIFSYISNYFIAHVEQGIIRNLRDDLFKHILKLPLSFFKNEKSGDIISRFTNDVSILQQSITQVFLNVFQEPLTVLVFFGIAFSISWKLTLFSLLIVPFSIIIIASIGALLRKLSYILQQKLGALVTILHETISGIKIVKAFGKEDYEYSKFKEENQNYFKLIIKLIRIRNISSPSTEIVAVLLGAAILFFGGKLVLVEHELKASEFMGFLFAIFQMMPSLKKMSQLNNKVQESIGAGMRIFEILDTSTSIQNIEKPLSLNSFKSELKFEDVTFSYSDSPEKILNKVSFTAMKGEIIAFVGSSGAGKTTLVDLIPRFFDPTGGKILIDGTDIKEVRIKDLRKYMGIVTQETILFNETVFNNIAYGLTDIPKERVIEVAKIANAHNFIEDMPNGYDTIVGEKGTKISGGQRQRLSIARALLKNPPIMIFDEATSALDNESEVLVQEAIEHLMKERTTFVIAHRLSTIRNADKIIVMDKGKIVQQGKHEELLADETGIYKKLYELQFRSQA